MSPETLVKWEILIDLTGFCCCAFFIIYFFFLRRKYSSENFTSYVSQQDNAGHFSAVDKDSLFNEVLTSVNNDFHIASISGIQKFAIDPYDEARKLLNAGMNPNKISEKLKIPRCEIEVIANLRQIQLDIIAPDTKNSGMYYAS